MEQKTAKEMAKEDDLNAVILYFLIGKLEIQNNFFCPKERNEYWKKNYAFFQLNKIKQVEMELDLDKRTFVAFFL